MYIPVKKIETRGGVSTEEVTSTSLKGSVFDGQGQDCVISFSPTDMLGRTFSSVCVPWSLRRLSKGFSGNYILSPLQSSLNALVGVTGQGVYPALYRFMGAWLEEMVRTLNRDLGRPRNPRSGSLVAVPMVDSDVFTSSKWGGKLSSLNPWQVGFSTAVLNKLNNSRTNPHTEEGSLMILSRFPTTDVVAVEIKEIPGEAFCLYVCPNSFSLGDEDKELLFQDLIEGDCDGDTDNFNVVSNPAQLHQSISEMKKQVTPLPQERTPLTWLDHEEDSPDVMSIVRDKIEQKTWIGSVAVLAYCGFAVLESQETNITHAEWREFYTHLVELVMDKKHNNKSNLAPIYGYLNRRRGVSYDMAAAQLVDKPEFLATMTKMDTLLNGESIREVASRNKAFRIMHLSRGAKLPQKFMMVFDLLESIPDSANPLEDIDVVDQFVSSLIKED